MTTQPQHPNARPNGEHDAAIGIRLPAAQLAELRRLASENGDSVSARVRELVLRGISNEHHHQELERQGLA